MSARKERAMSETSMYTGVAVTTALLTAAFVIIGGASGDTATAHLPSTTQTDDHTQLADAHGDDHTAPVETPAPATTSDHADATSDTPVDVVRPASLETPAGDHFVADNMSLDTQHLNFSAQFPNGAHEQPAYRAVMARISTYRDKLSADAASEAAAAAKEEIEFRPWDVSIRFSETARAGNLVSMIGEEYANTGGAHPNTDFMSVIADVESGEQVKLASMFMPGRENSPALVIGVCEALKAEKIKRVGLAEIYGDPIDCGDPETLARLNDGEAALAPSTETGKSGGLHIFFAPYAVGPYAEGPYAVTVSQHVFANDLRPEYQAVFGGDPA